MFPKYSQYKKWTLPSKYSFWGWLLGILGISLAMLGIGLTIHNPFADKDIHQEIAKEEYKPEVNVKLVEITKWITDDSAFLTIEFENVSRGPALEFSAMIVNNGDPVDFDVVSRSDFSRSGTLRIGSNKTASIPIVEINELKRYVSSKTHYENFLGVGKESSIPEPIQKELDKKYVRSGNGGYQTLSQPIYLNYYYKGIGGTEHKIETGFYAYLDVTPR